jgi:hypothetical protein
MVFGRNFMLKKIIVVFGFLIVSVTTICVATQQPPECKTANDLFEDVVHNEDLLNQLLIEYNNFMRERESAVVSWLRSNRNDETITYKSLNLDEKIDADIQFGLSEQGIKFAMETGFPLMQTQVSKIISLIDINSLQFNVLLTDADWQEINNSAYHFMTNFIRDQRSREINDISLNNPIEAVRLFEWLKNPENSAAYEAACGSSGGEESAEDSGSPYKFEEDSEPD